MNAGLIVAAFFVGIAVILVLITLHELGHFLIAKASGAYVYEFSIGYGPRIYTHKGKETWFSIRIFPLGGFCSIASDRVDPPAGREEESEHIPDERKMDYIARWKKALFIIAGPVMNFAIAIIMISIIFMATLKLPQDMNFNGNTLDSSKIAYKLVDDSLTGDNKTLFEQNSQNISITGWEVIQIKDGSKTTLDSLQNPDNDLQLYQQYKISKDDKKDDEAKPDVRFIYSNLLTTNFAQLQSEQEKDNFNSDLGYKDVWMFKAPDSNISNAQSFNEAYAPKYSRIVYNFLDNFNNDHMNDIDGYTSHIRLSYRIMDSNLYSGKYSVNEHGTNYDYKNYVTNFSDPTKPDQEFKLEKKNTKIGIVSPTRYFKNTTDAYRYSWYQMGNDSLSILKAFAQLFTGHVNALSGPVGTINSTAQMITHPEQFFLYVAALSANLFVLNCIPVPPLDGYKFIENGVEACLKREISQRTKMWLYGIGVAIFVIIFVVVTVKDFVVG